MVLLVPKALAKQIMCINTRRIEEGRGVSGEERGAERGLDDKHSCSLRLRSKEGTGSGEKESLLFLQKQELEMESSVMLLLALFPFVEAGSHVDSLTQRTSLGRTPSTRHWVF